MYYILRPKNRSLLTVDFTWLTVDQVSRQKNFRDLLIINDNLEQAQILSMWISPSNGTISPATPKTLGKKYGVAFPEELSDNYMDGIRAGKYPSCLLRKPFSKTESSMFSSALKKTGLEGLIPELKILAISKPCNAAFGLFEGIPFCEEALLGKETFSQNSADKSSCEPFLDVHDKDEAFRKEPLDEELDFGVSKSNALPVVFKHSEMSLQSQSALISNLQNLLSDIDKTMEEFPDLYDKKKQALQAVNGRIIDLEHIAELYDLNAADGYRLYRAIHDARLERRTIKNELAVLEKLESFLEDIDMRKLGQINACIENFSSQQYQTRTLTEENIKDIIHSQKTLSLINDAL